MTRAEQPAVVTAPANPTYDEALAADSRERAVRALLRTPRLRRLWSAQLVSGIGDALALLVLVLLALQAAASEGPSAAGTAARPSPSPPSSGSGSSPPCSSARSSSARWPGCWAPAASWTAAGP